MYLPKQVEVTVFFYLVLLCCEIVILFGLGFVKDGLIKKSGEGGGAGSVVEVSGDLKRVGDTCGAVVHEVQDYCFEV